MGRSVLFLSFIHLCLQHLFVLTLGTLRCTLYTLPHFNCSWQQSHCHQRNCFNNWQNTCKGGLLLAQPLIASLPTKPPWLINGALSSSPVIDEIPPSIGLLLAQDSYEERVTVIQEKAKNRMLLSSWDFTSIQDSAHEASFDKSVLYTPSERCTLLWRHY